MGSSSEEFQSVEGVIRTLLSALEERLGAKIKAEDKIVAFMAEYAAYLINRMEVGKDGKTAYERNKGKTSTVLAVEFGEKLLWKVRPKSRMEKLNARWEYGVFVGVKAASSEIWVATKAGLQAVRSVRRLAAEERWKPENKDWVRHVPWNKGDGDAEADGDIPETPAEDAQTGKGQVSEAQGSDDPPRVVVVNTREIAPREFYIKKRDLDEHGHTRGCPGCRTMIQGGTRQAHTAECRERFRELMKDDEKVRRTQEKRKDYEDRMVEKEQKKEAKKKKKKKKKREDARGRKRAAEDDDIEEERNREEKLEEERGQKRKAVGGDLEAERIREGAAASSEDMAIEAVVGGGDDEWAWDDVRGGSLDHEEVRKARREEVDYMKEKGLWEVVPRCRASGQKIVSVKWVDTNKGTDEQPMIRSRLVARDFREADKDREDLFAATPPWELKRLLMSQAANRGKGQRKKILLIDVKKAHLNPECKEDVYVELPMEAGAGSDEIGKLKHWLYGFRPAAAAWENHYADKLQSAKFVRGVATPVSFYNKDRDISLVVHGDDFTFVGEASSLDWIEKLMKQWFEVKVRARLGPDIGDDKEATLLGRIIRWNSWGVSCEADPKHRNMVMEALGLEESSKSLVAPGTKEDDKDDEQDFYDEADCGSKTDTMFRAIAAKVNYMAADMPDIQFACKEVCREMSAPTGKSWKKLKRIGRYLVGRQSVVWRYPWAEEVGGWRVYTDSDWAGNVKTRRSTSGGIILLGEHCVKSWSTTQSSPALSVCEAEYYALVEGATRALGMQTAARELGIISNDIVVDVATDSSGAKSFASRRGTGRIRHIEVKWLWLQQAVAEGKFRLRKIPGSMNPADVCTKYLTRSDIQDKLEAVNVELWVERRGGGKEMSEGRAGSHTGPWGMRGAEGSRLVWADAEDSEEEPEAAVGVCCFCAQWADDGCTSAVRGGV